MRRRIGVLILSVFVAVYLYAQPKTTIEGAVFDAAYKTPLSKAVVMIKKNHAAMFTNIGGQFSLPLPEEIAAEDSLVVYMQGYELKRISLKNRTQGFIQIYLQWRDIAGTASDSLARGIKKEPPAFIRIIDKLTGIIAEDWYPIGNPETNKFDFGRIQAVPSYNYAEGFRLRAGVASTTRLFPRLFVNGYVAYGFKDKRVKHRAELVYSFNERMYYDGEFPKNNLSLIHENDVYAPGESHPRELNDELLSTYRRSKNAMLYRSFTELLYERETSSGFAANLWVRAAAMKPIAALSFDVMGQQSGIVSQPNLRIADVGLQLRYSFGEAYQQNRRRRTAIVLDKPVLFFSHTVGVDGLLGGTLAYHRTEASVHNRFFIGHYGRLDAVAEVQKVWNAVPFPLLLFPNQRNQYIVENNAFYLTPAMEFVGDAQYAARFTFVGDALFLSQVPIFRQLGIKELISVRAVLSTLSDKNKPSPQNTLFLFPEATTVMTNTPYLEGCIGITNILGLFRLEYVHRFTYRNNPHAIKAGVRVDITL